MTRRRGARAGFTLVVAAALLAPLSPAEAKPVKDIAISRASSLQPESGSTVSFRGKAPTLRGKSVKLMRRVGPKGQTWVKTGTARVARDGTFTVAGVAAGVGKTSWKVKARVRKQSHTSPMRRSTTYAWRYLADQRPVDDLRWDEYGGSVGGASYTKGVGNVLSYHADYRGDETWGDYNLGYACTSFAATIGVDDSSETGYRNAFAYNLDGAESSLGEMGLGRGKDVRVDTTGRLRLRLFVRGVNDPPRSGYGVFANARVLCSTAR